MTRLLLVALGCLLYVGQSFAHGPSRLKVEESIIVKAPAAKVWALIGDFCTIDKWAAGIVRSDCQGGNAVGATRVLTIKEAGGAQIAEELQKYDAAAMSYKYKITKTDMALLPVTTYAAFLKGGKHGVGGEIKLALELARMMAPIAASFEDGHHVLVETDRLVGGGQRAWRHTQSNQQSKDDEAAHGFQSKQWTTRSASLFRPVAVDAAHLFVVARPHPGPLLRGEGARQRVS